MFSDLIYRLRALFRRPRLEREMNDELAFHFERAVEKHMQAGLPREEAVRRSRIEYGGLDQIREECREARGVSLIETSLRDLVYGLRVLRRNPGFAFIAVLTIALGIGANTAIFSVFNAVLLRYLPVRDPQQLYYLNSTVQIGSASGRGDRSLKQPMFEAFRKQPGAFSDIVAYVPLSFRKIPARAGHEPEEVRADMVSGNFFSGLGVSMERGRGFTLADETNHELTAVISYVYWTRRFQRNPSAIGESLYLKGVPFTIVGVTAQGFFGLEEEQATDVWIPMQERADLKPWGMAAQDENSLYGSPDWWFLMVAGRLRPDATPEQAVAQLTPSFLQLAYSGAARHRAGEPVPQLYPEPIRGVESMNRDYQGPLRMLMAMVALILLIACGNVAMLLVARNAGRQREFSLRAALGANGRRLFRQLFAESMILVALGSGLGWLFAIWLSATLAAWSGIEVGVAPDRTVLLFTLTTSLTAALIFGLAPLRGALRLASTGVSKAGTAAAGHDRRRVRVDQITMALQMAMCLVLLVGASLLVRTLLNFSNADLGIRAQGLLVFGATPPQGVHTDAEAVRFHQALLARLRDLPGVEAVTMMQWRIGAGLSNNTTPAIDGHQTTQAIRWNTTGPGYFHVLGAPFIAGRDFTDADTAAAPAIAIVDEAFARKFFPIQNPLGHRIVIDASGPAGGYSIVGVVRNIANNNLKKGDRPTAYFPYTQMPGLGSLHYELRMQGAPTSYIDQVRRTMREMSPDLVPVEIMTQAEQYQRSLKQERLFARLAIFFGALAAFLVATGLYGTLSYKVSRRTGEIGVRMALGAQRPQVLWLVLRDTLLLTIAGIAVGLPLAISGARLMRKMLYGMGPGDPLSYAAALAGILLVALVAAWLPARRAASVDPLVALRSE